MKIVDLKQNTHEWLDFRKNKIGASDIPCILGISPYKTPYQWWQEKCGFSENKYLPHMRKGHEIELELLKESSIEDNIDYTPAVCEHDEYDWAIASLDGFSLSSKRVLEIKYCNETRFRDFKIGSIPDDWFAQLQWQMFITDFPQVKIVAQNKNGEKHTQFVDYDKAWLEEHFHTILEMYDHVKTMTPPESDNKWLVNKSQKFIEAEKDINEVKIKLDEFKKKYEELKNTLIEESQGK